MDKDVKKLKELLEKITNNWDYYFLNIKFLQDLINYNEEKDKNYIGDLFRYFDQTLNLSLSYKPNKTFETNFKNKLVLI